MVARVHQAPSTPPPPFDLQHQSSTPLSMASAARDRLQASAREMMKNFEEYARKPKSNGNGDQGAIESAFRVMFSSCTSGAGGTVVETTENEFDEYEQSNSPNTISSEKSRMINRHQHSRSSSTSKREEPPAKGDIGEHIYAQLFYDDQLRAAKAVNTLRDARLTTIAQSSSAKSPYYRQVTPTFSASVPKPFPASAPSKQMLKAAPSNFNINATPTFDDSISAISAHTLEAMARNMTRGVSDMAMQTAKSPRMMAAPPRTPPVSVQPKTDFLGAKPSPFSRTVSMDSTTSKRSQRSRNSSSEKNSVSTRTTETSSFDYWQREEQKYWSTVTKKDQVKSVKGIRRERSKTNDNQKKLQTFSRHPHETFPFDVSMFDEAESTPYAYSSRTQYNKVYLPSHPEMAEI